MENIEEEPETYEQKLIKAQKHFTSKDQLLPFIPINPDNEPEDYQPFSEDEDMERNKDIDPNVDYEKVLDPDLGDIPRQSETPIF